MEVDKSSIGREPLIEYGDQMVVQKNRKVKCVKTIKNQTIDKGGNSIDKMGIK